MIEWINDNCVALLALTQGIWTKWQLKDYLKSKGKKKAKCFSSTIKEWSKTWGAK